MVIFKHILEQNNFNPSINDLKKKLSAPYLSGNVGSNSFQQLFKQNSSSTLLNSLSNRQTANEHSVSFYKKIMTYDSS